MSAECDKHGCHLVGHEFSEHGLHCPICVVEQERDRSREYVEKLLGWPDVEIIPGLTTHRFARDVLDA